MLMTFQRHLCLTPLRLKKPAKELLIKGGSINVDKLNDKILNKEGTFISSGVKVNSLDREKKWHFKPKAEEGKAVEPGEEIGEVKETSLIKHKVLVPVNQKGVIKKIAEEGDYTVDETIAILENDKKTEEIKLMTKWPVRTARPVKEKLSPTIYWNKNLMFYKRSFLDFSNFFSRFYLFSLFNFWLEVPFLFSVQWI